MREVKKLIKSVMLKKDFKSGVIADNLDLNRQVFYNWLCKPDSEALERLSLVAEILGCELALVDKATGEVYK